MLLYVNKVNGGLTES